jgi:hypothetical protein
MQRELAIIARDVEGSGPCSRLGGRERLRRKKGRRDQLELGVEGLDEIHAISCASLVNFATSQLLMVEEVDGLMRPFLLVNEPRTS